jgi:class 3 adenylate cyclase
MEDIRAVMDDAGLPSATLIGLSEGGSICAMFAASNPERVERLVLIASFAHYPRMGSAAKLFERAWGDGMLLEAIWARGVRDTDLLGRIERAVGTPKSMAALMHANGSIDVRPVLPLVTVPSLVVHCAHDPVIDVANGRELASLIPTAQLAEVDGDFHGSGKPDEMQLYLDAMSDFLADDGPRGVASADRVLATVLFSDIVGSTQRAAELGDARWAELLDDHDRIAARAVAEGRGRVVKTTGDGVLAAFDGPATAITAAHRMIEHLGVVGLDIRVGIHTGEVERRGDDIGGLGVNLAARVLHAAADGEVWVSSTVPGLTVGAPVDFEPRGRHALKGIPGEWDLYVARLRPPS